MSGADAPVAARFVYAPELATWELADGHPFKPIRLELTRSLLRASGLLDDAHEVRPEPIDDAELERVHDPAYVDTVRRVSRGDAAPNAYAYGLGTGDTPIFAGMHRSVRAVCAATRTAVDEVASGRATVAVSLSGGLHHAHRARASGFCVYNDLAVGIEHAARSHGLRVAYVDLDAHHGDGVQSLFWDRRDVLTISLHESGRYLFPGSGHAFEIGGDDALGTAVNVPLEPMTDGDSFLDAFDRVVPAALRAFAPDLIVLQAGADMHRHDPLTHLGLELDAMRASYARMRDIAREVCGGRLVATGGGGYDPYRTVPRAWGWLWAELTDRALPDPLPAAWREAWRDRVSDRLPERPLDAPAPRPARAATAEAANRAVVGRLLEQLGTVWNDPSYGAA